MSVIIVTDSNSDILPSEAKAMDVRVVPCLLYTSGYKEFKTAAKIKAALDELGYEYTDGHAVTGIITPVKGRDHKINLAIMGELDAVIVAGHPKADPVTGAAHSCGHSAQATSVIGVAAALKAPGIMENLDGDITLMHVPSEEFVELEYRQGLKAVSYTHLKQGSLHNP